VSRPLSQRVAGRAARQTVAVVAIANAGVRQGARACAFVVCWGIASERLGHDPSMVEYAEVWGESVATAYRERDAFKVAFPMLVDPAPLWAEVGARVRSRDRAVATAELFGLPFPMELV